jgi:hypothetical protein
MLSSRRGDRIHAIVDGEIKLGQPSSDGRLVASSACPPPASARAKQRRQHVHRGRLARTVMAQQTEDLTACDS